MSKGLKETFGWIFIILVILSIVVGLFALFPRYNIYRREMHGKAELAEATWNRQIEIEEAAAKLESASLLAAAEVERAKGVAAANEIIGDSLQDNDAYLRYLWIQGLNDSSGEVIYVATEANLPILEATRLDNKIE